MTYSGELIRSNGFTLIETVVVISILSIMGVGLFTAHIRSVEVFIDITEEEKLSSESWIALHRMTKELRHASSITSPLPASPGGILLFQRPPGSYSSCVSCQDRSLQVRYSFDKNNFTLIRETAFGAHIVADNVSSFLAEAKPLVTGNTLVTLTLTRMADASIPSSRIHTMTTSVFLNGAINKTWREVLP